MDLCGDVAWPQALPNSCLHPAASFSAEFVLSASRGYSTIIRLALVMAT